MYSHIKPLATLLACLLDEDLRTDIASKLKHHLPVTLCTKGTHVLVRHARHTVEEKKITYLDRAEMSQIRTDGVNILG
jgi:transcriptional antiterminator Rof (Rho-off)